MNHAVIALLLAVVFSDSIAATGRGPKLDNANVSLDNLASLQRGARVFMNYCASCHSAKYVRYNRIASDLKLSEEMMETSLMFTTNKIGDTINVAMRPGDSERWFGVTPPDLSVIARSRSADWLYSYFNSFYIDEHRSTGVNNIVFADTAMPHVLWELQGMQKAIFHKEIDEQGREYETFDHFEMVHPGKLTESEYRQTIRDLVTFLVYIGEPAKLVRYKIGFYVLAFLVVLLLPSTYLLKREYWKDIH